MAKSNPECYNPICNIYNNNRLTFQITVLDEDGAEADCRVWGDDPGAFSDGCDEWI